MSDDDVNLGRKLYRAIQEEKECKESSTMVDKLARLFVALLVIIGLIAGTLLMLGGPK